MLNSRDLTRLRSDVEHNCRTLLALASRAGYDILVTGTVRDWAFQQHCYEIGTGGPPPPTFHSIEAGLAFDIVKRNPDGSIDYGDNAFWDCVGAMGEALGFTWGGRWKFVDKPHFQWDEHGTYYGSHIKQGKYPPPMPARKESDYMVNLKEVEALVTRMLQEQREADEAPADWAEEAWLWASQHNFVDGDRPTAPVSRQEVTVILQRYAEFQSPLAPEDYDRPTEFDDYDDFDDIPCLNPAEIDPELAYRINDGTPYHGRFL